jgi:3-oxoacyl-[acyl-carrier protein] reductase
MFVTGASGGVGRELLDLARSAGWNVVGIYHSNKPEADVISRSWDGASGTLRMLQCDLADSDDVSRMLRLLPEDYCPDVVVHLAAPPLNVNRIQRVTWEECQSQINGTLKPVVMLTPLLVKRMARRGIGRVICALSSVVFGKPPRGFSSYTVAKYAMLGYMNCLAAEYAERGIAVNTVSPGPMNTGFLRNLPTLMTDQMRASVPGGKWIEASSVAGAIFWLASDAPRELTGCNLPLTSAPAEVVEEYVSCGTAKSFN